MLFLNTCIMLLTFAMTAEAGTLQRSIHVVLWHSTSKLSNSCISVVLLYGIPNFWEDPLGQKSMTYYLFILVLVCTLFPILNSLFTGGGSLYFMLRTILPFYLFLPTLVSSFGAYPFARTFDLSWGNRPPSELKRDAFVDNATKLAIEKAQVRLKEQSQASCGFILMFNLIVVHDPHVPQPDGCAAWAWLPCLLRVIRAHGGLLHLVPPLLRALAVLAHGVGVGDLCEMPLGGVLLLLPLLEGGTHGSAHLGC